MVKNKMSLTFFRDWTMQLQDRMHAELNVLCEKNVALQVDNNIDGENSAFAGFRKERIGARR